MSMAIFSEREAELWIQCMAVLLQGVYGRAKHSPNHSAFQKRDNQLSWQLLGQQQNYIPEADQCFPV